MVQDNYTTRTAYFEQQFYEPYLFRTPVAMFYLRNRSRFLDFTPLLAYTLFVPHPY